MATTTTATTTRTRDTRPPAQKLLGTLARYGWKIGVHKNPAYDPASPDALRRWRFFAVTPTETWGAQSKEDADRALVTACGQLPAGVRP